MRVSTGEEVHVFISDIKRKRRKKYVRNICLLRDKGASWDGFPVVLKLKKNEIKSLKQETRKTIFFLWYLDGLFLSSFQKIPSSNVRFIDSRRDFTN